VSVASLDKSSLERLAARRVGRHNRPSQPAEALSDGELAVEAATVTQPHIECNARSRE
jgi:hypothetical protein